MRSTTTAVLTLSRILNTALQDNKFAVAVFFYLRKAFDTVDHGILLYKLRTYGFRNTIWNVFQSYLQGRQQMVIINNIASFLQFIQTVVPHGSVLGPLLYLLYMNDLPLLLTTAEMLMYAYDTALIITDKNLLDIEKK